jgi:Protein of unknown function (DUF3551)
MESNVMRTSLMIAIVCCAVVASAISGSRPAEADGSQGSYCLEYSRGGADCSFTSLAQCNATASGIDAEYFAVSRQAATQEPGAYAFYQPDARLGIDFRRSPQGAMAAMPTRSRRASSVYRSGSGM